LLGWVERTLNPVKNKRKPLTEAL
ncbi:ABC transporter permease, partial [Listeria monocytogenes]